MDGQTVSNRMKETMKKRYGESVEKYEHKMENSLQRSTRF